MRLPFNEVPQSTASNDGSCCAPLKGQRSRAPVCRGSAAGSTVCDGCDPGKYLAPNVSADAPPTTRCRNCLPGADCSYKPNVSLAHVQLAKGRWRLSPTSRSISECLHNTEDPPTSPCVGGNASGVDGSGYCVEGHYGPLCQLCDPNGTTAQFFDTSLARCRDCPVLASMTSLVAGGAVAVSLSLLLIGCLMQRPPLCLRQKHAQRHPPPPLVLRYRAIDSGRAQAPRRSAAEEGGRVESCARSPEKQTRVG